MSAPLKEPGKCAFILNHLFSEEELKEGILFKITRSPKPALDQERVEKMFGMKTKIMLRM